MLKGTIRRLLKSEGGFALAEIVIATAIVGTSVVASMALMAQAARATGQGEDGALQLRLVQNQIETIHQFPFQADPSIYPTSFVTPEGSPPGFVVQSVETDPVTGFDVITLQATDVTTSFTVTLEVTDAGLSYTFPEPDGTQLTNVVQLITVSAQASVDIEGTTLRFYKLANP